MKKLEKLPDTELIKLTKEHEQAILENNKFLDNFEQHFDNFKECYFLLEKKVGEINEFFYSNFKIESREVGVFSKSNEYHLIFNNNTKNEYLKKFKEINNIYVDLLNFNKKFLHMLPSFHLQSTKYISDDLFQSNHKKEYHHTYHLFDFMIGFTGIALGTSVDYYKSPRTMHDGEKLPGVGIFDVVDNFFQIHDPSNTSRVPFFKSCSESLPLKELVKTRDLPRPIAGKKDYENEFKNIKEDKNKILRKIELILRKRKKGKEKIENVGYVYVLSNKAYPNIYKIGSTYSLPEERAEELTGTGHLTPFKVVAKTKIQSAEYYEKSIHKLLTKYRVKQNKEFFELELDKIKDCLQQVSVLSEKGQKKVALAGLKKKIKIK